jgi:sortase A
MRDIRWDEWDYGEPRPSRRRRWFGLAVAVAILAGACATTVVVTRGDDETAVAQSVEDSPLLEPPRVTTTTTTLAPTTTATVTTTTTVPLPVPAAPPKDPYERAQINRIGAIYIPKIGLQHALYEGVSLTVIDHGPGHWPGTAMPGQVGNTVFPGHRVTHSHPFLDLDKLAQGDQVVFQMPEADYVYQVVETIIVRPTDMWVVDQGTTPTFTLIACHPKHSAAQRIVVKGDLIATMRK